MLTTPAVLFKKGEKEGGVGVMHGFILNAQILLGLKVAVVVSGCEFRTLVLILKSKDRSLVFLMFFQRRFFLCFGGGTIFEFLYAIHIF